MQFATSTDSQLAFFTNQLELVDPTFIKPLIQFTWMRDIALRPGVTLAHEATSFVRGAIGGAGTNNAAGLPYISGSTTALPGVDIDGTKVTLPVNLLARDVSYTQIELQRAMQLQQSIERSKLDALNMLYQQSIDQTVYIGDSNISATGLLNSSGVSTINTAAVVWTTQSVDTIIDEFGAFLNGVWAATGYTLFPDTVILPPAVLARFGYLKVSTAGNIPLLDYLSKFGLCQSINGKDLKIVSTKWATTKALAYTNSDLCVRFPLAEIVRMQPYYQDISFHSPFVWGLGQVELLKPESLGYCAAVAP